MEPGEASAPKPGDFSVCLKCSVALRFSADGLRAASAADLAELTPASRRVLELAQRAARRGKA